MPQDSSIEWTDKSWNPVTGCDEVSPGCDHCYAKVFAERWRGVPGHAYEQGFDLKLWPARLGVPLTWKKPARIFVNSMSDLFHKDIPDSFILQVFTTMRNAHWHTFQVLTKRPKHAVRFFERNNIGILPANVWMGTTIENNDYTWRADELRKIPARVRFISAEPLLSGLPSLRLDHIHWLIAGGESGHGARPAHPDWFRDLRDRCNAAGVAYFFKQWGQFVSGVSRDGDPFELASGATFDTGETWPHPRVHVWENTQHWNGEYTSYRCRASVSVGKHAAGRLLDGREWNEMPV